MFSSRLAQASRLVASSSVRPLRSLHATAAAPAAETQAEAQKRREEREGIAKLVNPHVVLGHKPGDEAKWLHCDLARILVTPEEVQAAPPLPLPLASGAEPLALPTYFNFGLGQQEKSMLFEALPELSTERSVELASGSRQSVQPEFITRAYTKAEFVEKYKANMFARVVDLRNANARGIAFENRRRCIAEFSEPGKPDDTGRPEVQAALLTMQIRHIWDHLSRNTKDVSNRRSLRHLVHKRAKILKYLKRLDADRYDLILRRLGLEPASVEGELNV